MNEVDFLTSRIMNDKLNKLLENRIYNHEKCVAEIEKIADAQSIDFAKWCVNTQAFGAYTYEDALEIFKAQQKLHI